VGLRRHPQFWAYVALAAVCFFWGTTYLGIRMALESFPPTVLLAVRFLLSGAILLLAAWWRGAYIPRGRELWLTAALGILILGVGNGCLVFAELWIPSGLAALFITLAPFWMVGIDSLLPAGKSLHGPTLGGMAVGLVGTVMLVGIDALQEGLGGGLLRGFLLLQLGSLCWSAGSLVQRRVAGRAHPIVTGAVQQFAVGIAYLPIALIWPGHPVYWSARGVGAVLYLVVFGSIIGYSAYVVALDRLPVALVTLYNYVNPVVAVILGWIVYREPFGTRQALAMLVIFAGVALVRRFQQGQEH
jgi:drug/metabolite transporter (DMT)-like permease